MFPLGNCRQCGDRLALRGDTPVCPSCGLPVHTHGKQPSAAQSAGEQKASATTSTTSTRRKR